MQTSKYGLKETGNNFLTFLKLKLTMKLKIKLSIELSNVNILNVACRVSISNGIYILLTDFAGQRVNFVEWCTQNKKDDATCVGVNLGPTSR